MSRGRVRIVALLAIVAATPTAAAPDIGAIEVASRLAARLPHCGTGDGVRTMGGRVVAAGIYAGMEGFARQASTTGGLGLRFIEVTRLDDLPKATGTLRWAVNTARKNNGGWIGFSRSFRPGSELPLTGALRLPANVTIDGGCVAPLITSPTRSSVIYIQRTSNVVLTRIRVAHVGPPVDGKAGGDCVTISHGTDRVWIGYSEFSRCTDGLVDITQSGVDAQMRVTVSHNYMHDHDKAMLLSGDHCADNLTACAKLEPGPARIAGPNAQLTLQGNVFRSTGQRHPRVSGRAYAHVVDNVVLYGAQRRLDGSNGATYGAFAANGGTILAENSLFLPLFGNAPKPAIQAQGADTVVSGRGAIRVRGIPGSDTLVGGNNLDVPEPGYTLRDGVDFAAPVAAARCVANRAGVGGWEQSTDTRCR